MIHDDGISNKSGNRPFEDVLQASMSRRHVLVRTAALSATGFLAALAGNKALVSSAVAATTTGSTAVAESGTGAAIATGRSLINFPVVPAALSAGPDPVISAEYEYQVLIPWGSPLQPGGPTYWGSPNNRPKAWEQARQIGIGHDGMWFFSINGSNSHGMLAINHEFGTNPHVLGKDQPTSLSDVRLSQHAHGVSVVEIKKTGRRWQPVRSANARRIHVNTPVTFSGPAAGSDLLKTPAGNPTLGTVNNCANGYTPWGTYLTCEENFNGYFGAKGAWTPTEAQERYGFSPDGFGYGWHLFDRRFDLSNPQYKNEENRFGWVVEIDPTDGKQVPVKRTALGRFKHEGVALAVGSGGRVVCYMGDDERFDYIYKFVSEGNWQSMRAQGISPLDRGKLYVARFKADGTGNWLELSIDNPRLKGKFKDQAEVVTYARLASDILGATPMDRPEWTTLAPTGEVYCTLTNNSRRTEADAANPLAPNPNGHIIRWKDKNHHLGTTFTWDIFVLSQDTHSNPDSAFSSPDGLWADEDGRLFIQTDGSQPEVNGVQLNDQMLVADTHTGEIRRIFAGVAGCEVTGITVTPDRKTMFINLQHPGDGDPALTSFPDPFGSGKIPRDATLVVTKKDGGIIGS